MKNVKMDSKAKYINTGAKISLYTKWKDGRFFHR